MLLRITPVAGKIAQVFTDAGYRLILVGGSVRDCLMGRLGNDLDFTTDARPDEIERLLRKVTRATWDMGREFGTIGGRVKDGTDEWIVEITTYRADTYHPDSRKPDVVFGDTLEGDLVRRDFTVNAMGIDMADQSFIDPYGGLADLARGEIRTPTTPQISFSDDPLRMMRAARFASQLGFMPVPEVVSAMTDMAGRIDIISAERVRDELNKLLLSPNPRAGLDLLVQTGIAEIVLPELPALKLTVDEHQRHKDVYEHSLTVVEQAIVLEKERGHEPDLINRLAALLHDIGKPRTRKFEATKVTFHHHDLVGAKMAKKRMTALHYSADEIKAVAKLIELHLRFHGYSEGEWTDAAVRRYVRDAGEQLERLHMLTRADCTSRNQRKVAALRRAYDHIEERIAALAELEELDAIRPDLNGDQIMTILGIAPGPVVGKAYNFLLERRLDSGPLGAETAEAELRTWWAEQNR
ncbi:MAG: CCA tRNA nucleotidyltransferase [Propionibacteriaceae bacterium]